MGRSVSTPRGTRHVFYLDWTLEEDELAELVADTIEANGLEGLCRHDKEALTIEIGSEAFEDLVEDTRYVLGDLFPSVYEADRWIGREDRVIAENRLAQFGVSEYCGLAAIWVVPSDDAPWQLAERWIDSVWPRFEAKYPSRLGLAGRFSNGEAVYERTTA